MKFRTWVQTHFSRQRKKKPEEEKIKPLKLVTRGHSSSPTHRKSRNKNSKLSKIPCLKPSNSDYKGFVAPNGFANNTLSSPESAYSTAHSANGDSPRGLGDGDKLPPGYNSPFLSRNKEYYTNMSDKSTYSPSMYRLIMAGKNDLDDIDESPPSLQESSPSLELPLHQARDMNGSINISSNFQMNNFNNEGIRKAVDDVNKSTNLRSSLSQLNDISCDRHSVSSPRPRNQIRTNPWMSPAPVKAPIPKTQITLHSNLQNANSTSSPFRMTRYHSTESDITMKSTSDTNVTRASSVSLSSFPCSSNRNSTSDSDVISTDLASSCRTSSGFYTRSLSNGSTFSYYSKAPLQRSSRVYDTPLLTSSSEECIINDNLKSELCYRETDILSDSETSEWTRGLNASDLSDMFYDDSDNDIDINDTGILVSNFNYECLNRTGFAAQQYRKDKNRNSNTIEKRSKPNTLELKVSTHSIMEKLKEEEELFQEQALFDKQADEKCRELISATEEILKNLEKEIQENPVVVPPCHNQEEYSNYRMHVRDVLRLNMKDVLSPIIECPTALSQPSTPGTPLTPCVATPSSDWFCGSLDSISEFLADSKCSTPMSDTSESKIPGNVVPSIQKIFKNLRLMPHMKDVATSPLSPGGPPDKFAECIIPILSNIPEEDASLSDSQASDDQLATFASRVDSLKLEKKDVELKISEAREEEKSRKIDEVKFQEEMCSHKRQLLLDTLHSLKENLEEQSNRLQDAYKSTINMQIQIRKQRSQLQNGEKSFSSQIQNGNTSTLKNSRGVNSSHIYQQDNSSLRSFKDNISIDPEARKSNSSNSQLPLNPRTLHLPQLQNGHLNQFPYAPGCRTFETSNLQDSNRSHHTEFSACNGIKYLPSENEKGPTAAQKYSVDINSERNTNCQKDFNINNISIKSQKEMASSSNRTYTSDSAINQISSSSKDRKSPITTTV